MPRKKRMQKPVIKLGPLTVRAVKGEPGRWLWRAEFYPSGGGGKMRTRSMSRGRGDRYDREEAIQRAVQMLADGVHLENRPGVGAAGESRTVETVRDLLEAWLGRMQERVGGELRRATFLGYRGAAKRLVALPLASVAIDDVQAVHCSQAVAHLRARYADSTTSQALLNLRMAWRWGVEEGILLRPFPGKPWLRGPSAQHMPTVDDVLRTLDHLNDVEAPTEASRLRNTQTVLAAMWMLQTGARPGEVALAHVNDIDWRRSTWTVRNVEGAKTGERIVPIHTTLLESIKEYVATDLGGASSGGLWPPLVDTLSTTDGWRKRIRRAAKSVGVEPWSPKGLRHLAVTRMLAAGIDVATAASITGHSPEILLRSYAHVLDDRRRAAVQALAAPAGKVVPFRKKG